MKNYEKYADEIRKYDDPDFCDDFIIPNILKSNELCSDVDCKACQMICMIWLLEEYEEPETDWSKVEVDTPILVRADEAIPWARRYFAKYEDGIVYVWNLGRTSWSADNNENMSAWPYAKLAESEEK